MQNSIEVQVEALDALLRQPGWEMVKQAFQKQANAAFAQMEGAANGEELQKHTHVYLTTLKLLKLPELLRETLAQKLQTHTRKL